MSLRRFLVVPMALVAVGLATDVSAGASTPPHKRASVSATDSETKTKPLTKQEYIARYNALCDDAIAASQPIAQRIVAEQGQSGLTPGLARELVTAGTPILRERLAKTQVLQPPKRDRSRVQKILRAERDAENAVAQDPNTLFGSALDLYNKADSLALAYGLESGVCFALNITARQ